MQSTCFFRCLNATQKKGLARRLGWCEVVASLDAKIWGLKNLAQLRWGRMGKGSDMGASTLPAWCELRLCDTASRQSRRSSQKCVAGMDFYPLFIAKTHWMGKVRWLTRRIMYVTCHAAIASLHTDLAYSSRTDMIWYDMIKNHAKGLTTSM